MTGERSVGGRRAARTAPSATGASSTSPPSTPRPSTSPRRGTRLAVAVWSAVVLALAAVPLASGYDSAWVVAMIAAGALLPFGLVALGLRLGVRRWAVGVGGTALGVAGLLVVLRPIVEAAPTPSWRTASPGLEALAPLIDAVPRLLTAPRPAPVTPDLLAPVILLVWLVALAVALVPATRTAPLVGAAVLYVAGALLTAGEGDRSGVVALVVVLVLAVGWIALPREHVREAGQRRPLLLPTAGAVIAACFALVAASLPTTGAFEPRVHVPPPQLPATATNPIPDVTAWQLDGQRPLFVVAPGSQPLPDRMALAALADFDGATWTLEARLRAIGVVDEPLLPEGRRRAPTDLTVRIEQLGGVWLPSVGTTTTVDGAAPVADVDTGALVLPDGLRPGQVVRMTGNHDAPTPTEVERAGAPPVSEAERFLELPRVPQELRAEAAEITDGAASRLEQALALEEAVRAGRLHDLTAQSGSSYGRLMEFLFLPEDAGGHVGTAEQFAGAFAVMARSVGLPSRLVVGFDIAAAVEDGATASFEGAGSDDDAGESGGTGTGEVTGVVVRGEHATIWPEVYFANAGWVPFQPTPPESTITPPAVVEPSPEPREEATASPEPQQEAATAPTKPAPAGVSVVGVLAVGGVAVTGIVVLLVLAALTLRLRRRRRWRAAGPRGAWAHVLDAVVLRGHRLAPGQTVPQLVDRLDPAVREPAMALARDAEAAAFGPPSASGPAGVGRGRSDTLIDHWQVAGQVERSLRAQLPWWRRLWWWVSLRDLRHHDRPSR